MVIHNNEEMIGYANDILDELKDNLKNAIDKEDFDQLDYFSYYLDLMKDLKEYDDELVKVSENVMGGYLIARLKEER
jgi:hypothetical protein